VPEQSEQQQPQAPSRRSALRNPRGWTLLILGTVAAGIAVAVLLDTSLGMAPVDAMFTGISRRTGISVGTALIGACIVMVVVSWILGVKPGIGTVVSFFGIGLLVDATTNLLHATGWSVSDDAWPVRLAVWVLATLLLAAAASCLYASGLGASPYDQFVQSMGRFHLSIPVARVIVDAAVLIAAWLLGGAWGIGTVGLLLLFPLILRFTLPMARRLNPDHQ